MSLYDFAVGKTKDGKTCKFHAGGVAGKRYQYRVKAVNSAAEGKESDESKSVLLKSDFGKFGFSSLYSLYLWQLSLLDVNKKIYFFKICTSLFK